MHKLNKKLAILVLLIGVVFAASTANFAFHVGPLLFQPPLMDYSSGPDGEEMSLMAIWIPGLGGVQLVRWQAAALLGSEIVGSLALLGSGWFLLRRHRRLRNAACHEGSSGRL